MFLEGSEQDGRTFWMNTSTPNYLHPEPQVYKGLNKPGVVVFMRRSTSKSRTFKSKTNTEINNR